jgi:hypothetical protein
MALGQMGQDFRIGPRKPCTTWYTIIFFEKTPKDKYEAETISVD